MNTVSMVTQYSSIIMSVVAAVCILISVITEFTKEIGFLKKIPTMLQVLFLSILICVVGFFAYISYAKIAFVWYYLVAVIFGAFIIALICAKGWEYFAEIVKRFWKKD